jgi:transcriptional regulator with XRE-family HTH domain
MVRESPDPTGSIYALMGYYLRFLRNQRRLTQAQVGELIGCTKGQVSKYEAATRQLDSRECAALDKGWETGGLFTYLLGYAKLGVDPNWPARHRRYQREATAHYIFANDLIPLPFQTEEYARGPLEAGHAAGFVDDVDAAIKRRMELQAAMLDRRPEIWAVLDEVALRPMGGPEVMAGQRDRLLELGALAHVSIRILPLSAAPHIGVDGSFKGFRLPGRRLAAFSGSALGVGRVIDDQEEAADVVLRFHRIAARAWSEDQSRAHIAGMSEDL